jgi:DNA repair exonuclease SbcCD ATPase subunit
MIINSIGLKNFKSYGNNMQKVHFEEGGELILLSGDNEVGKSSLIESIDFTLYGIVRGKNTKKIAITKLPNRQNKCLETEIDFINDIGDKIIIRRKVEPTSIEVLKNGKSFFKEFKNMTTEDREEFIGLEYNTYKSLISLNLSDFANFVNLDSETKRKLLNKLFDIKEIDEYFMISKDILKNSYKEKERIETIKLTKLSTIETYKENIENIKIQTGNYSNKEDIKKEMLSHRNTFTTLKHEIKDLSITISQLSKEIKSKNEILEGKKSKILQDDFILKHIIEKIKIFKSGICPTCDTILEKNHTKHKLEDLEKEESDKREEINTLKSEGSILLNEIKDIVSEKNGLFTELNNKNYEFNNISDILKDLKKQYETEDVSINEINKNIQKLEDENKELDEKLNIILQKIKRYTGIVDYLSEKGIRKNIIGTIIEPVNKNLEFFLKEMESRHTVKLNDEFDALIKDRYMEEDPETLSIGGARKINIAIALSYIKTILDTNRKINILFLDDVFSAVSPSNVNIMIRVLKEFARDNNINIVIVHQGSFDTNLFDRVINIEMKYFSTIIDTKIKKKDETENG